MSKEFLPITKEEMIKRGWDQPDFVYVIGDAYVDHPSFGPAIISRLLESHGFKVAMIPQPDWKDKKSIDVFGRPRLGFLVSAGNMDSMVNHYTVSRKKRSKDSYTPGGVMGKRPDYAVVVYCNLIRQTYKDVPIIIGGIEASLRRLAHYDYWSNKVKRSILMDSQADLLEYGMGEHATIEVAEALDAGIDIKDITYVAGTAYRARNLDTVYDYIMLPSYEEVCDNKKTYAESFFTQYQNTDAFTAKTLVESYGNRGYVVQNPPAKPLSELEMDDVYKLPYKKTYHPSYEAAGGIPAIKEVKFSLVSNRGCFGGCNFCALTFHQGRIIQTRSHESIIEEAKEMTKDPDFKGYIHDVGGPTANFRQPACKKQMTHGVCKNKQCLWPTGCSNMEVDHSDYIALLRKLRKIPKVKKVFVRSGIRFDYVVYDKSDAFLRELCKYHVSGQLKVAPEHISDRVLEKLGKPKHDIYLKFVEKYIKMNEDLGMDQYLVPYLMSSHPGSTLKDAIELALYLKEINHQPEQVQDFYPTPMTLSTTMYYTGLDPRTMQPVYVPRSPKEKQMQRALMQYKNPANYDIVVEALKKAGRMDLIGYGPNCLLRPRKEAKANASASGKGSGRNSGGKTASGKNAGGSSKKKKTIRNTGKRKKR